MLYQLSLLHAVLCGKAEESHACMPMKMEQLPVLSVLRPNEIQVDTCFGPEGCSLNRGSTAVSLHVRTLNSTLLLLLA